METNLDEIPECLKMNKLLKNKMTQMVQTMKKDIKRSEVRKWKRCILKELLVIPFLMGVNL
jgi:hypothetical protein